jgi:hypothetical protein
VRPLYSNAPLSPGSNATANSELASIAIKPVKTRYAQQVRNNGSQKETPAKDWFLMPTMHPRNMRLSC